MLKKSTLQLLRFHFSIFLMPIYWFALSQTTNIDWMDTITVFIILHVLVYPASNGYNSYMDRDTGSIGGIKHPMQPTRELYYTTLLLDALALILSLTLSIYFFIGILSFICASRAYSYRGIRLKQYPFLGFFTVIFFQGAVTFFLVKHGSSVEKHTNISYIAMLASLFLVGGFYPLTQIYQHEQDKADGVKTISSVLGYKGTFAFTAAIYGIAIGCLALYFASNLELGRFFVFQLFMLPVLVYFVWWYLAVAKNTDNANYKNTMRMNLIAAICTNAAFITILILDKY